MKIINLQGMTFAERQKYLEEITQEIYNHLYDDYIWTSVSSYTADSSYSFSSLKNYNEISEVKSYQIVYFANNGYVALIDQINSEDETFTVTSAYQVKGDKGDKGDTGEQGEQGQQGEPGKNGTDGKDGLDALVCKFAYGTSYIPTNETNITQNLNNFTRTPKIGDRYILVIYGINTIVGRSWLCVMNVLSVSDSSVIAQPVNVVETTGKNGTDGTNGLNALEYSQAHDFSDVPTINSTFTLQLAYCNRNPVEGDNFTCIINGTDSVNGRSWLVGCTVIYSDSYKGQIKSIVETTGASGADGSGLIKRYLHTIRVNLLDGTNMFLGSFSFFSTKSNAVTSVSELLEEMTVTPLCACGYYHSATTNNLVYNVARDGTGLTLSTVNSDGFGTTISFKSPSGSVVDFVRDLGAA